MTRKRVWKLLLVLLFAATNAASGADSLRIEALIDGRSLLIVADNSVRWHHEDEAAPGRAGAWSQPTVLNGIEWFPQWPQDGTNRSCDCTSSRGQLPRAFAYPGTTARLQKHRGRGDVVIAQAPAAENDHTLVIAFDDSLQEGAAWYEVELGFDPPTLTIGTAVAQTGEEVSLPVTIESGDADIAAMSFSVDYDADCLAFDPSDDDSDGIPDAIVFKLADASDPPTLIVRHDALDVDGELDISLLDLAPPLTPIPDGQLLHIAFTAICTAAPNTVREAPVAFSAAPAASFGDVNGNSVNGTTADGAVFIVSGLRGDCNSDMRVNAGDLVACVLENFDGDGSFWLDVPGGMYQGSPVGCDANADTAVNAGDLSCKLLLIFDGQGACDDELGGEIAGDPRPGLMIPRQLKPDRDRTVQVPIFLRPGAQAVNSLIFSLDLDERYLYLDPTDADGDGIPDAVRFHTDARVLTWAASSGLDTDGELDFFLLHPTATFKGGRDQPLLTLTLEVMVHGNATEAEIGFSTEPAASFGTPSGRATDGATRGGSVRLRRP